MRYPHIRVQLTGLDGSGVLARVIKAMREAGVDKAERDVFLREALAGEYRDLLAACFRWVDVR